MSKFQGLYFCTIIHLICLVYSASYGDGDWHVYPRWIYSDHHCYDFVDTEPYKLARLHVDYDSKTGTFGFLPHLDVKMCVSVASYAQKKIILHIFDVPNARHLETLAKLLGDEYSAVWLHYDLFGEWSGTMRAHPFSAVIVSIAKETHTGKSYTHPMLHSLIGRVRMVPSDVLKCVQLNADMVRASTELEWQNLIPLVNFTIIYKEHKKGERKESLLKILNSPIPFTIWDTESLLIFGKPRPIENDRDWNWFGGKSVKN